MGGRDGGFIPVGPGRSLAGSGPGEGRGLGHSLGAVPGASPQQTSAAGEEVLGPEGEAGQRGQVSTASCGRRARVQGLDLNPGRFHKRSGGLPAPPCPPSVVPPAPGMREQPAEASSQHRASRWEYSGIVVLFTRMLRALCWVCGCFGDSYIFYVFSLEDVMSTELG